MDGTFPSVLNPKSTTLGLEFVHLYLYYRDYHGEIVHIDSDCEGMAYLRIE